MKRKLMILTLLCLLMAALAVCVSAETVASGSCNSRITWALDDAGTLTISGTGDMPEYTFSALNTTPPWYDYRADIISVVIEEGVTSIGKKSFCGCVNMESITVASSVTKIGSTPFTDCSSLKNVYITDPNAWCNISFYGFANPLYNRPEAQLHILNDNGEEATQIILDDSVTQIPTCAFKNCDSIVTVVIPDSVTSLGGNAFSGCSNLTQVSIGSGMSDMSYYDFLGTSQLESILVSEKNLNYSSDDLGVLFNKNKTELLVCPAGISGIYEIPTSVTKIGSYAFNGCGGLSGITIPDRVVTIDSWAFDECTGLTELIIPESVTKIGPAAFSYCSGLVEIRIPEGITEIGYQTFYKCSALEQVYIPDSVAAIGTNVFYGCSSLKSMTVPMLDKPLGYLFGENYFTGGMAVSQPDNVYTSTTYYIPDSLKSVTVNGGVLPYGAFYDCSGLTDVTLTDAVTAIGAKAFMNCSSLTGIVIPDGVTTVETSTFENCTALADATLGKGITSIGESAFEKCSALKSVVFPEHVTDIGRYAFFGCSTLTDVVIPDGVTSIGNNAFWDCSSLENVTIGNGVTSIGSTAFGDCTSLTTVTIPDNVTSIGSNAFQACSKLNSVAIGKGVTEIAHNAFSGCNALKRVDISDLEAWCKISFDGDTANPLFYAKNLYLDEEPVASLVIPDAITKINDYAFYNCDSLTAVVIPESVTGIGGYAFSECSNLLCVTLPVSVTSVNNYGFSNCTKISHVLYAGTQAQWSQITIGSGNTYLTAATLHCEASAETITKTHKCSVVEWDCAECGIFYIERKSEVSHVFTDGVCKACGVPEGLAYTISGKKVTVTDYTGTAQELVIPSQIEGYPVTSIGVRAFASCSNLTQVTIPESVTDIGNAAFIECTGLTEITVPDSVTSIGKAAFAGCTGLESMTLPFVGGSRKSASDYLQYPFGYIFENRTDHMGTQQYYYGSSASGRTSQYFVIPESIRSVTITGGEILYGAFSNCSNLESITIPDNITAIGGYAFYGCSGLPEIEIPQGVTAICDYAFYSCTGLTEFAIPQEVTTIGEYAFYNCRGLDVVTIPGNVTTIDDSTFRSCVGLTEVTIPDSVSRINANAFRYCSGLQRVVFEGNTGMYGGYNFGNCSNLKEVTFSDSITTIGESAFRDCTGLESITIPGSVTGIQSCAFSGCSALTEVTFLGGSPSVQSNGFYLCNNLTDVYVTDANAWCKTSFWDFTSNPMTYAQQMHVLDEEGNELTQIVLDSTVTKIPDCAFRGCSMTAVVIPDSVTSIGSSAFSNCTGLNSVTIPDSVTSVGSCTFENCSSLVAVTIPDSVTTIGSNAFYNCNSIKHVIYSGSQEQWAGISIRSYNWNLTDASRHYGLTEDPAVWTKNCENKGLFCPLCDDFLTRENAESGSHTFTDKADITCDDCGYTQKLTGVSVHTLPETTDIPIYTGTPDLTGGQLKLTYSRGGEVLQAMTEDMITGFDNSQLGQITLTATYEGFTTTFAVRIIPGTPDSLTLTKLPDKTEYFRGDALDLTGLVLTADYGDYGTLEIPVEYVAVDQVDMATAGTKTVTVNVGEKSVTFEIAVYDNCPETADPGTYPESAHNYASNTDETKTYTVPGAFCLTVTFSGETAVEQDADYIYLYDGDGNEIAKFTGSQAAGKSVTIPGDTVKIRLTSDDSVNKYGYSFASIVATKTQHQMGQWEVHIAPSCTDDGQERMYCQTCDYYETRTVEATGHTMGEWQDHFTPTCIHAGMEIRYCANCLYSETRESQPTGHAMGDWETYKRATCYKEGEERRYCTHNCGLYESRPIDILEHEMGQWFDVSWSYDFPNCRKYGIEHRNCRNCSYYESREFDIPWHQYDDGVCICCGEEEKPAYNGLVVVDGVWGYYEGGELQVDYTGLVPYGDILFYVENGILDFTYTGLVWHNDAWRYVANSQLTEGYTGLVWFNDNWFYTVDSVIDWTFTGLVPYEGNYFYVQNNLLDWSYTGLGYHDGGWYFIQNGLLQKEYSGLVYFNDNWFYVEEGVLTYQYFGMVEYQGNLFYVQASHLDWSYTGLGFHEGNWYYFQNALYTPSYNGLVDFNGSTFYVEGGIVDWSVNGLREFEGKLYYIRESVFDNTFNGEAEYDGTTYTVVDGVAEL